MVPQASPTRRRKARVRHLSRTVLTLGVVLLLGVIIGLAAEIWLREIGTASGVSDPVYTSAGETLALALGSLEAAAPLVAALVATPLILAGFLRHLYGTVGLQEAQDRLNHTIFGALGGTPRISVRAGRIASGQDRVSGRLGNPAQLTVYDDSAVVTERYGSLARILGTGVHTLRRHETIWETIDLRPQRWVREVYALTKEGIPITVEVDIVFQIGSGRGTMNTPLSEIDPEQASTQRSDHESVLRAATATWMRGHSGYAERKDWTDRVASMAESAVRDTLATYRLDWLIKAPQWDRQHPRDEIHGRLREVLQTDVQDVGANLVDVKVGELRVGIPEARAGSAEDEALHEVSETVSAIVSGQWIDAWHANWQARTLSSRAEDQPELLPVESARVEAQAEIIVGLVDILQPLVGNKPSSEPYAVATRLVEALHWMSFDPRTRNHMPPEALRTLTRLQRLLSGELDHHAAAAGDDHPQITQTDAE